MNPTLETKLTELRRFTTAGGVPVRRKDAVLYGALAACLELCEFVQSERLEQDLRDAVVHGTGGTKGSRFFKHTSDVYIMVCRYAFGGPEGPEQHREILPDDPRGGRSSDPIGGPRRVAREERGNPSPVSQGPGRQWGHRVEADPSPEPSPRLPPDRGVHRSDGRGFFDVI